MFKRDLYIAIKQELTKLNYTVRKREIDFKTSMKNIDEASKNISELISASKLDDIKEALVMAKVASKGVDPIKFKVESQLIKMNSLYNAIADLLMEIYKFKKIGSDQLMKNKIEEIVKEKLINAYMLKLWQKCK